MISYLPARVKAGSRRAPTLSTFSQRESRVKKCIEIQRSNGQETPPFYFTTAQTPSIHSHRDMPLTSVSSGGGARRGRVFVKGFDYYGNLIVDKKKKSHPTSPTTKKWNTIRDTEDDCSEFLVDNNTSTTNIDTDSNINPSCVGEFFTCFRLNVKDLTTCAEEDVGDNGMTAAAAYHAGRADAYMTAAAMANTRPYDSYYVPPTPALVGTGEQQYYYASPIDYPYGGGTSHKSPLAATMYYPPPQVRMQQLPVRMAE